MPDLGEGVTEGQIIRVMVAEGDHVSEDQPLMEVETDKAAVEIPSPHTGIVEKLHVKAQQLVNVGDVMVTFSGGETVGEAKAAEPARPAATTGVAVARSAPGKTKPASPAVRKLARQLGIDLNTIEGTGPAGRVTREDLEHASTGDQPTTAPAQASSLKPQASLSWGPTHREPLTRARKAIAEAMVRSVATIPHATDTDDADVTELDGLRRDYQGTKLTVQST